jgi:hypothetical protein
VATHPLTHSLPSVGATATGQPKLAGQEGCTEGVISFLPSHSFALNVQGLCRNAHTLTNAEGMVGATALIAPPFGYAGIERD